MMDVDIILIPLPLKDTRLGFLRLHTDTLSQNENGALYYILGCVWRCE